MLFNFCVKCILHLSFSTPSNKRVIFNYLKGCTFTDLTLPSHPKREFRMFCVCLVTSSGHAGNCSLPWKQRHWIETQPASVWRHRNASQFWLHTKKKASKHQVLIFLCSWTCLFFFRRLLESRQSVGVTMAWTAENRHRSKPYTKI